MESIEIKEENLGFLIFENLGFEGVLTGRKNYMICLYPEIYAAFKLLCDQAGYRRLNYAVERIMLKRKEDRKMQGY